MTNRIIKFRAWDIEDKEMLLWDNCQYAEEYEDLLFSKNVMQFTGLKDKNGKEIYEGDIVKCKVKRGVQEFKGNALIIWSDNLMFDVKRLDDGLVEEDESLGNYDMDNYEIEVIGNIYENQEFLKNKK